MAADRSPSPRGPIGPALTATYLTACLQGDRRAAAGLVASLLARGAEPETLIRGLLVPAQEELGRRWERGELDVAEEHVATGVTETVIALTSVTDDVRSSKGRILLALAEHEWHLVPARLAAELLTLQGWQVTLLAGPMPAEHLRRHLLDAPVDLVGISCTLGANLGGARQAVAAAHDTGHRAIVGGRAFGTTNARAKALGADGWIGAIPDRFVLSSAMWPPVEPLARFDADRAWLTVNHDSVVDAVLVGLGIPAGSPEPQHRALRDDVDWIVRFLDGALAVDDPTVLSDLLAWMGPVLGRLGPAVPALGTILDELTHVLADGTPGAASIVTSGRTVVALTAA